MATAACPHCFQQVEVPELAPVSGLTCPWCLTRLNVEYGPVVALSYADIEQDMLWDDDDEDDDWDL